MKLSEAFLQIDSSNALHGKRGTDNVLHAHALTFDGLLELMLVQFSSQPSKV